MITSIEETSINDALVRVLSEKQWINCGINYITEKFTAIKMPLGNRYNKCCFQFGAVMDSVPLSHMAILL